MAVDKNAFVANATTEDSQMYDAIRPSYPVAAVQAVLLAPEIPVTQIADIGSGTGIFAKQIHQLSPQLHVFAVEPSPAMRSQLPGEPWLKVCEASSEKTGLPDRSVQLITWAQSFHWVDPEESGGEAARILQPGGAGVVVANQMDVTIPWVHRLTRIMRSGDVHRVDRPPKLPGFVTAEAQIFRWEQVLLPGQVLQLARTRSSYLRSKPAVQQRMQNNLRWYLSEHLGYGESDSVTIPYSTLLWVLRPQAG